MSTLSILFSNPLAFASYFFLLCTLVSCWVVPKYALFIPLYIVSYVFGYYGGIVTYPSLFPITLLLIALVFLKFNLKRFVHLFSSMTIAIIGVGLMTHMIGGFHNLLLFKEITFGSSSVPMNIYLNFDRASLAILILGLYIQVLKTKEQWKHTLLICIPWIAFSAFILLGFSKFSHLVELDVKFPSITLYWLVIHLFFVVIPEEVFYRGFLQNEITKNLSNKAAPILAILVVSLLFTSTQLFFSLNIPFLAACFIGSILYGTIFHFSGSVESAIFSHFTINIIHFFFFSYPFHN
jgi:membrane protease YdiL (CAAX protease family)